MPDPTPARSPRHPGRRLALSLVIGPLLAVLALSSTPAQAAEGDSPDPGDGWIRAGHLAAGNGSADVRLTPFAGGESVTVPDVAYGDVTPYTSVEPGLYTVAVLPSGGDMTVDPMVSTSVRVEEGGAVSVFALGDKDAVRSRVIRDDLTAPADGQARVRLLSAAPGDQEVTAEVVDGPLLAEDVGPGQATGYAGVAAQTWTISVTADDGSTTTGRVPVEAGGVYTLLAVADEDGSGLRLEAVEDAIGSATTPQGGVDTGAGGLAGSEQPGSTAPYAAAGGVLVLIALLGFLGAAVRGRHQEAGVTR